MAHRSIVIPLYDHTSNDEIADILGDIGSLLGIDGAMVVTWDTYPNDLPGFPPRKGIHEVIGRTINGDDAA